MSEQLPLLEGEERIADLEATRTSSVTLTNRRVFVKQANEGVDRIVPLKLEYISSVKITQESPRQAYLIAALLVCSAGAALLPQLTQALGDVYSAGRLASLLSGRVAGLLLGALGVGLVVAGLVLLARYLRSVVYPVFWMVFRGSPEVSISVSAQELDMAREMISLIQEQKAQIPGITAREQVLSSPR
jgi:hypothetical protein